MNILWRLGAGILAISLLLVMGFSLDSLYERRSLKTPVHLFINRGMGGHAISDLLEQAGLIPASLPFRILQKVKGLSLQAGEYIFFGAQSPVDIMDILTAGRVVRHHLTIPEGLNSREILKKLEEAPLLQGLLDDIPEEGTLLPETYDYTWGDSRSAVLKRMHTAHENFLASLNFKQTPVLKNLKDVVILASIVEKETGLPSERPHVASVFLNRLAIDMPLQSDPTILYGLTVKGREPDKQELRQNHPYNTYTNRGLPPGPICHPGKDAIKAVLQPQSSEDLYFVANGKGGHIFAKTLAEHQKNHTQWRQLRKQ